jgi:thioredoxin 1
MAAANVHEFTDDNFGTEVEGGTGVTVVDFWAPWCGPCRMIAPMIEQLASEYEGRVRFGKLNVDDNVQVASRYGIRSIPTVAIFKDGEAVDGIVGAAPKAHLERAILKHVADAA